jgi:hypothetical protein
MQLLLELWRLDRTLISVSEWAAFGARWLQRFVRPPQDKE